MWVIEHPRPFTLPMLAGVAPRLENWENVPLTESKTAFDVLAALRAF